MKDLAIELYSGLDGWGEGLVTEGFRCVGFDIVDMCAALGRKRVEGCRLVIQDVRTLHGSQFKNAAVIVASPPCQEFSYMAMPWSRAKQIEGALRGLEPFPEGYTGSRTVAELTALFDACFRIQREACEAAGRYIPLIVENVRGAQKWVGRAKANFGSYYLWGDVGMVGKRVVAGVPQFGVSVQPMKATKVPGFRFDGSGGSFQSASVEATGHKTSGMNWSDRTLHGQDFTRIAGQQAAQKHNPDGTDHGSGSWFKIADSKNRGAQSEGHHPDLCDKCGFAVQIGHVCPANAQKIEGYSDPRRNGGKGAHLTSQRENDGREQPGISGERNNGKGDKWFQDGAAAHGSKSNSRKAASAQIAKIPFPLALHIARCFRPGAFGEQTTSKQAGGPGPGSP